MKVLVLSRYSALGASSRLRTMQYIPELSAHGFEFVFSPLLDDDYLRAIYAGQSLGLAHLLRLYWKRLKMLLAARHFDLIWIEKEVWPWVPAWIELALLRRAAPVVVDFDDAIFHNYDKHPRWICRKLYANKIRKIMQSAHCVTAGSQYLIDYAMQAQVRSVAYLPTVVDLNRYQTRDWCKADAGCLVVGWIGSPFTVKYLLQIVPALEALAAQGVRLELRVVGAMAPRADGVDVRSIPWEEISEANEIAGFDVGVMPLDDSPWERGKCAYKLIQYMACGVPVIASPVGMNCEVVVAGENGFLAGDTQAWVDALARLAADPQLRQSMGRAGRLRVEQQYCTQITSPKLASLLADIATSEQN